MFDIKFTGSRQIKVSNVCANYLFDFSMKFNFHVGFISSVFGDNTKRGLKVEFSYCHVDRNSRSHVAFYILISRHIQEAVNLPARGTLKEL